MDSDKDSSDGSLGYAGLHLHAIACRPYLVQLSIAIGFFDEFGACLLGDFVLDHVLVHHSIVKLVGIPLCYIVVYLALFRLDHIGTVRVDNIGDSVIIFADFSLLHLFVEMGLGLPSICLLVHQTTRRRFVLSIIASIIELTHDLVKRVHTEIVTGFVRNGARFLSEKSVELSLNSSDFCFIFFVSEHVGGIRSTSNPELIQRTLVTLTWRRRVFFSNIYICSSHLFLNILGNLG